ncbi:MAG: hypothetical protein QM768_21785 [Agriterribacter sp.]
MNEIFQKINKTQMRSTLAFLIIVGVFALVAFLQFREVPPSNRDIMYMSLGVVISTLTTVVNFYYGTSKGETDKQKADLEEK